MQAKILHMLIIMPKITDELVAFKVMQKKPRDKVTFQKNIMVLCLKRQMTHQVLSSKLIIFY